MTVNWMLKLKLKVYPSKHMVSFNDRVSWMLKLKVYPSEHKYVTTIESAEMLKLKVYLSEHYMVSFNDRVSRMLKLLKQVSPSEHNTIHQLEFQALFPSLRDWKWNSTNNTSDFINPAFVINVVLLLLMESHNTGNHQ